MPIAMHEGMRTASSWEGWEGNPALLDINLSGLHVLSVGPAMSWQKKGEVGPLLSPRQMTLSSKTPSPAEDQRSFIVCRLLLLIPSPSVSENDQHADLNCQHRTSRVSGSNVTARPVTEEALSHLRPDSKQGSDSGCAQ